MAFGLETGPDTVVNIKVIGVGGGGNNVVNRMVRSGTKDHFIDHKAVTGHFFSCFQLSINLFRCFCFDLIKLVLRQP